MVQVDEPLLHQILVLLAVSACLRRTPAEGIDGSNVALLLVKATAIGRKVKEKSKTFIQLELFEGDMDCPVPHLQLLVVVIGDSLEVGQEIKSGVSSTRRTPGTVSPIDQVIDSFSNELLGPSDYIIEIGVRVAKLAGVGQRCGGPDFVFGLVEGFKSYANNNR